MSQAIATRDADVAALAADIRGEKTLAQIQSVLPDNVPVSRFVRAAITAVSENPDLVDVDRNSLFLTLVKCAQDGLLPDSREAAILPFNDKKRGKVAAYIPMIGGFRKIAGEHGWSIETAVVRQNDTFDFERGSEPRVVHRQPKLGADRGPMVGAYAIGRHHSMPTQIVVLDAGEVEKVKKTSKALNFGPWKDWEPQMWEKTAGRKLFKQLPLGERETERIRRMLADTTDDPIGLMYGTPRPELSAAVPPDPTAGATESGGGTRPQAAPSSTSPEDGAAPGFDWDSVDTPEPEPQPAQESAGAAVIPGGRYVGQTIAEVASKDEGRGWLLRMLHQAPPAEPTRMAIEIYVRGDLPDLWGRYQEEKQAAEESGQIAFGDAA